MSDSPEVGKPYISGRAGWPEAGEYSFGTGGHELHLFMNSPSTREVYAVRQGPCEFALVVEGPVIVFLYRFGPGIPLSDAPYSWHLVPEEQRSVPDVEWPETRALLRAILVNARTGLIRALRLVSFSPEFTRALYAAIRSQAGSGWVGQAAYNAALAEIYRRYPSTSQLLSRALAKTKGGE